MASDNIKPRPVYSATDELARQRITAIEGYNYTLSDPVSLGSASLTLVGQSITLSSTINNYDFIVFVINETPTSSNGFNYRSPIFDTKSISRFQITTPSDTTFGSILLLKDASGTLLTVSRLIGVGNYVEVQAYNIIAIET